MKQPGWQDNYTITRDYSALVCNGIIVSMMACVGYGLDLAGARLLGEAWKGGYFLWLFPLFSIEAIYAARKVQTLDGRDKAFFRAAEILTLAILLKTFLLVFNGPLDLPARLAAWEENFVDNFLFEHGFLVVLLILLGIWGMSGWLADQFDQLHDREQDAVWDELGKLQNALSDIRARIFGVITGLGLIVVLCAILARQNIRTELIDALNLKTQSNTSIPIANVLVYFVLALLLFSQTQFALLRTRWSWNKTPISPSVGRNWIRYSAIFLAVLGLIVFLMPTNYALGFIQTLGYALNILLVVIQFLIFIITYPFALCLRLLPFKEGKPSMELPSAPSSSPPDPTVPQSPLPFWEFLRSALFWLAFVVIVIFALYQYFSANKALWGKLISIPFIRWISQSFKTLWRWMRGVNQQVAQIVRATLQQLRPASKQLAQQIQQYMRQSGMLSARDRVRFIYLNLVELGNKNGVVRDISQTPNQYRSNLTAAAPEAQSDIDILTDAFLEARYSNHPIDEPRVTPLQRAWENIRDTLIHPSTPPTQKKD